MGNLAKKDENKYSSQYIINKWRKDKKVLSFIMNDGSVLIGILIDFSIYEMVILLVNNVNNLDYNNLLPMVLYKHSISRICSLNNYNNIGDKNGNKI